MKVMSLSRFNQMMLKLTEEEARELIAEHVVQECCYSSRVLKTLTVVNVASCEAFYYTLISWYEKHTLKERYMPYHGGPLDSRINGLAPATWELKRPIPAAFTESEYNIQVPHSEETLGCPHCYGVGYISCRRCRRKGNVACASCHGQGEEMNKCTLCFGKGSMRCPTCRGRIGVECGECAGSGRLKRYLVVQVAWGIRFDCAVLNGTEMPSHRMSEADGFIIHRQVGPRVGLSEAAFPLSLVMACEVLVNRHLALAAAPDTRVLLQKHIVRLIPLSQCDFRWGGADSKVRKLFVYGRDRRIHRDKAPTPLCTLRDAILDRSLRSRAAKAASSTAGGGVGRPATVAQNPSHSVTACALL